MAWQGAVVMGVVSLLASLMSQKKSGQDQTIGTVSNIPSQSVPPQVTMSGGGSQSPFTQYLPLLFKAIGEYYNNASTSTDTNNYDVDYWGDYED